MRRMYFKFRLAAVAIAASTAGSIVFAQAIDVGIIDSLTGSTAVAGTANVCGFRIAADVIREGKLAGDRSIRLMIEDDQSKPAVAAQAASKLTAGNVKFFVGGSISSTVLAELPILKDAGALHFGGTTKAEQYFQAGALVVRLNSDNSQDGESIGKYVSETLKAKRIDFVALQGAYGEGALASIKVALAPGSVIEHTYFAPADSTNFQSIVTSITANKPDAVVWAIFGNAQPVALMRQYRQAGLTIPLIAGAGTLTASLAQAAGGAADGVVSADLWAPEIENAANRSLRANFEKYKSQFSECGGKPLDKQVAISYAQLMLLAQSVSKAKSTDPKIVRDTIVANSWDLPQGQVRFRPEGQAIVQYYMLVGKGDKVLPLQK